jgi:hypothetical protein
MAIPAHRIRRPTTKYWNILTGVISAFAKLRKATISCVIPVRPSARNSAPTGRICMKFDIWVFSDNLSRRFKFHYNLTGTTCILREDVSTFMKISRWIIFRIRNILGKIVQKIRAHILCSLPFFQKSCQFWDNVEKYGGAREATDDNVTRRMRFGCWITKATNIHSEYVILIAFTRQQWLREISSMLRL